MSSQTTPQTGNGRREDVISAPPPCYMSQKTEQNPQNAPKMPRFAEICSVFMPRKKPPKTKKKAVQ